MQANSNIPTIQILPVRASGATRNDKSKHQNPKIEGYNETSYHMQL
jgi:hypothetical protein